MNIKTNCTFYVGENEKLKLCREDEQLNIDIKILQRMEVTFSTSLVVNLDNLLEKKKRRQAYKPDLTRHTLNQGTFTDGEGSIDITWLILVISGIITEGCGAQQAKQAKQAKDAANAVDVVSEAGEASDGDVVSVASEASEAGDAVTVKSSKISTGQIIRKSFPVERARLYRNKQTKRLEGHEEAKCDRFDA